MPLGPDYLGFRSALTEGKRAGPLSAEAVAAVRAALAQARTAAGDKDVLLSGGGHIIQQYLAAGVLDELELHVVPVLLSDGARIFDNLGDAEVRLEQVRAVEAPGVTHLKYRVVK